MSQGLRRARRAARKGRAVTLQLAHGDGEHHAAGSHVVDEVDASAAMYTDGIPQLLDPNTNNRRKLADGGAPVRHRHEPGAGVSSTSPSCADVGGSEDRPLAARHRVKLARVVRIEDSSAEVAEAHQSSFTTDDPPALNMIVAARGSFLRPATSRTTIASSDHVTIGHAATSPTHG